MTRCKKYICVMTYPNSDKYGKYCVVWYKYKHKVPRIVVYFNGHSQEEWKQYWQFFPEEDGSLTYILKKECSDYEENLRQAIECPTYIPGIAEQGFSYLQERMLAAEKEVSQLTGAIADSSI